MVYDLLFKASSEAVPTIAADPEHMGGRIGITAVLVHMIVPGGGIALDGKRWLPAQQVGDRGRGLKACWLVRGIRWSGSGRRLPRGAFFCEGSRGSSSMR